MPPGAGAAPYLGGKPPPNGQQRGLPGRLCADTIRRSAAFQASLFLCSRDSHTHDCMCNCFLLFPTCEYSGSFLLILFGDGQLEQFQGLCVRPIAAGT